MIESHESIILVSSLLLSWSVTFKRFFQWPDLSIYKTDNCFFYSHWILDFVMLCKKMKTSLWKVFFLRHSIQRKIGSYVNLGSVLFLSNISNKMWTDSYHCISILFILHFFTTFWKWLCSTAYLSHSPICISRNEQLYLGIVSSIVYDSVCMLGNSLININVSEVLCLTFTVFPRTFVWEL